MGKTVDTGKNTHTAGVHIDHRCLICSRNFELVGNILGSIVKCSLHAKLCDLFIVGNTVEHLTAALNKLLNLAEKCIDKTVFVDVKALFTVYIEYLVGSYSVTVYSCYEVGMLCKMANRLIGNTACLFNRHYLLLLYDETTGVTDDGIKLNNAVLYLLDPADIDLLILFLLIKRDLVTARTDILHNIAIELIALYHRDKIFIV